MTEDARAVAVEMLIEGNTIANVLEESRERCLTVFQRPPAKVLAVEFDKIEGAQDGSIVAKADSGEYQILRDRAHRPR